MFVIMFIVLFKGFKTTQMKKNTFLQVYNPFHYISVVLLTKIC